MDLELPYDVAKRDKILHDFFDGHLSIEERPGDSLYVNLTEPGGNRIGFDTFTGHADVYDDDGVLVWSGADTDLAAKLRERVDATQD